jgi:hypothetical protein
MNLSSSFSRYSPAFYVGTDLVFGPAAPSLQSTKAGLAVQGSMAQSPNFKTWVFACGSTTASAAR